MSNDILAAINIALLPVSLANLYYALTFQNYLAAKGYNDSPLGLKEFVIGQLCWQMAIFMNAGIWLIWDYDWITLSMSQKLNIVPRMFFIMGSLFFFFTFNHHASKRFKDWFIPSIIFVMIGMYFIRVLW